MAAVQDAWLLYLLTSSEKPPRNGADARTAPKTHTDWIFFLISFGHSFAAAANYLVPLRPPICRTLTIPSCTCRDHLHGSSEAAAGPPIGFSRLRPDLPDPGGRKRRKRDEKDAEEIHQIWLRDLAVALYCSQNTLFFVCL